MTSRLSARERRTLVGGAIVAAVLVLFTRGVPAWRRWDADARGSAREMTAALARARSDVRTRPAMLDSLEQREARLIAYAPMLLEGETHIAAGAALASLVSGAAAQAGVVVGSVQLRPDTAKGRGFTRVRVQADGTGDLPSVTRWLAALEQDATLLSIQGLSITQPDAGGPAERPEVLRVEITVEALALPEARGGRTPAARSAAADPPESVTHDTTARGRAP
jgi:hypothetical protein